MSSVSFALSMLVIALSITLKMYWTFILEAILITWQNCCDRAYEKRQTWDCICWKKKDCSLFGLNVRIECSNWMFELNVWIECSDWMFGLNVRIECSNWMFGLNVRIDCSNWMFGLNVRIACPNWLIECLNGMPNWKSNVRNESLSWITACLNCMSKCCK